MSHDYQYRKRQSIAMTIADAADFERDLLAKIPELRVVREPVEDKWMESWKWGDIGSTHFQYNRQVWKTYLPPVVMRNPEGDTLIYRKSIAYPWDESFLMWIEPEGWKPEWIIDHEFDATRRTYRLANRPRFWCEFRRSYFNFMDATVEEMQESDPDWFILGETWRPPICPNDRAMVYLTEGSLRSSWRRGDKECQSFARKIFRIADKYMSNTFRFVDRKTLMPEFREAHRTTIYWAGHHAMKWAAERRHNYIFGFLKPPEYDFGPDEPEC